LQTKVEDLYNDNNIHVSLMLLIATSDTTYLPFSDYAISTNKDHYLFNHIFILYHLAYFVNIKIMWGWFSWRRLGEKALPLWIELV